MVGLIGAKTIMELQRYTTDVDGGGGQTETFEGVRRLNGVLWSVVGDERLSADRRSVIATHYFKIDFPIGETVTEKDRLAIPSDQRVFDIKDMVDVGQNQNRQLLFKLLEIT